jgi:post-segregation antitoxin (ccd killing protein)
VAKISVSLDDELLTELKTAAGTNVSAFVAAAIRRQLRRGQLDAFLAELDSELGPATAAELADAAAAFDRAEAASVPRRRARRPA